MSLPRSPAELARAVAESRNAHNAGRISITKHLQKIREVWQEAISRGLHEQVGEAVEREYRDRQFGA